MLMGTFVNSSYPRVPNPVDPAEDFADKWSKPKYKELNLEQNFWNWLRQARSDFELLLESDDASFITEQAGQKFSLRMDSAELSKSLGLGLASSIAIITPKEHTISQPAKPWRKGK